MNESRICASSIAVAFIKCSDTGDAYSSVALALLNLSAAPPSNFEKRFLVCRSLISIEISVEFYSFFLHYFYCFKLIHFRHG